MSGAKTGKGPSRRWLYGPLIGFALLVGLYTAYWFFAIGKIEQGLDEWIAQQRAEGIEIDYAAREFGGFPYRFMVTFDAPSYRNWQVDWRGEELELFMQPWNFRHAIARMPGRNEVVSREFDGTVLLDDKSAASFRWDGEGLTDIGLTLNLAEFVSGEADVSVRGLKTNYAARGDVVRLGVDWDGVTVSPELIEGGRLAFLGPEMQQSRLRVRFTGLANNGGQEGVARRVDLAQLRLNWGPLKFGAKGDVDITPAGYLDGPVQIRLDDAEALSAAMKEAGRLPPQSALIVQAIGAASEDGQFLSLQISDGALTILGIPLLTLPPVVPPLPRSDAGVLVQ